MTLGPALRVDPAPLARCGGAMALAVLLAAATAPAGLSAQSQTDMLLHGTPLSYSGASKDGGFAAGVYGSWGVDLKHLAELGGTFTRVRYSDGFALEQVDLAAAYSRYWARGSLRVGGHYVEANDPLTDGALVLFGGAGAYRVGMWGAGAEAAYSRYGSYGSGLEVLQVAPSVGFSTGRADRGGVLGLVLRGYWIRLHGEQVLAGREFTSGEAALHYTISRLTLSGTAWAGEQAFAVRNGGFLLFNIAEVHTGGYGGGARLVLSQRTALAAGVYVERFVDTALGTPAMSRAFALSLGFTL